MPASNPNNPSCPLCGLPMGKNGINKTGAQQYRCRRDGKAITDSDRPVGGQIKGDRKLTQKELTERWKLNDPEGYKKSKKKSRSKKKK